MTPEQEAATLEALRLTGDHCTDVAVVDHEDGASLAALFMAALGGSLEPMCIAQDALCQLSSDLTVLGEALASDIAPGIISATITGMADRARVAAEVSRRIMKANPRGVPAPKGSEVANG